MPDRRRKPVTQEDRVLDYMKKFGSITSLDAFIDLGVTRLSAIIFNIRINHYVKDTWECRKNRFDEPIHYKRYYLSEEE